MKIDIQHREETKGWLSKQTFHVVDLKVLFSEEETQIIKQNNLQRDVVMERGVPADRNPAQFSSDALADVFNIRINTLMDGKTDSYAFQTPAEAKQYAEEIRELMPQLKDYIMANAEIEQKSDSFEL